MTKTIIAIDGLDGSGKSTITKMLIDHLIQKYKEVPDKVILYQHFPNYQSLTGHKIKKKLTELPDEFTEEQLDEWTKLFMVDRDKWWLTHTVDFKAYPENTHFVIIFDRYRMSNLFLNAYRYGYDNFNKACDRIMNIEKTFEYPVEDINIFVDTSKEVLLKRMEAKEKAVGIDKNETPEAITKAYDNFKKVIHYLDKNSKSMPPYITINGKKFVDGKITVEDIYNKICSKVRYLKEE
jgi:thymidylate kinase